MCVRGEGVALTALQKWGMVCKRLGTPGIVQLPVIVIMYAPFLFITLVLTSLGTHRFLPVGLGLVQRTVTRLIVHHEAGAVKQHPALCLDVAAPQGQHGAQHDVLLVGLFLHLILTNHRK